MLVRESEKVDELVCESKKVGNRCYSRPNIMYTIIIVFMEIQTNQMYSFAYIFLSIRHIKIYRMICNNGF